MILRAPRIEDYRFIYECYQDWPLTDDGPVTEEKAVSWLRRWIHRSGYCCRIAQEGDDNIGLVVYQRGNNKVIDMRHTVYVSNLVVHPSYRRRGFSTEIIRTLRDQLVSEGVTIGHFETFPDSPLAEHIRRGRYRGKGQKQGKTGQLLVGEITADMDV